MRWRMVPARLLAGQPGSPGSLLCVYNLDMTFTEQLSSAQLALAQGLGIDVYRLRRSEPAIPPDQAPQESGSQQPAPAAKPGNDSSVRGDKVPGARGELALMRAALGVDTSPNPHKSQDKRQEQSRPVEPAQPRPATDEPSSENEVVEMVRCDLIAWRSERVFLVCSGEMLNDDSERLIQGLLRALDPGKRAISMQFSWPAGGGGPSDAHSAGKAWRAFWQRRTDGAQLVLATADALLEQWLADAPDVHWLPALDTLVGNGEGKRALWQALAEYESATLGKGKPVG